MKSDSSYVARLIALGLLIPCLLISIPAILAFRTQGQLSDSFHWVSHTIEVQHQIQRLLSLLVDAETGERGYLLSTRDYYLEPYTSALSTLPQQISTLRSLTSDNSVQQKNLRELGPIVAAKLDFMARAISLQQQNKHEAALALTQTDQGKQMMDAIRNRLELMDQEESRLLVVRQQYLVSNARFSSIVLAALVILNLCFAGVILIMIRRLTRAQSLVTICAWSRTVEYQGEWLSFEEYLLRRFDLNTSHGISPAQAEKTFGKLLHK